MMNDPLSPNLIDLSSPRSPLFPTATKETTTATIQEATALFPLPETATTPIDRAVLSFFVACTDVDGNALTASSRSSAAHTLVRGALNMLSQTTTKSSPRTKAPAEINVEVRASREVPLVQTTVLSQSMDAQSWSSERQKSRHPHFAVGFQVACDVMQCDRHVQIMIMVPEDNKNSQVYGYAQTSFQEMYAIATSGHYETPMILPVYSTAPGIGQEVTCATSSTVTLRFVPTEPQAPVLFAPRHPIIRSFIFAPPSSTMASSLAEPSTMPPMPPCAMKVAIEEAAEVDYSLAIPVQLLKVCQSELQQMYDEWKARYNYNRKMQCHFEDEVEALEFRHDVFRVQVVGGRQLMNRTTGGNTSSLSSITGATGRLAGAVNGGAGIMNRLKNQAGKWTGPGNRESSMGTDGDMSVAPGTGDAAVGGAGMNAFVVVKYTDGLSQECLVGRTNTEYDTIQPVWSSNKAIGQCPHSKPNTKYCVSPSLPSRVEISPVNTLKQFVFFRPSCVQQAAGELQGWLRFEVFNEKYGYMSGLEHEFIGEVLIPLQSLRDAMGVEEKVFPEHEDGSERLSVMSLTLVDWFDVRSPQTDEVCGQIQLRINILLANPAPPPVVNEETAVDLMTNEITGPRKQRLVADVAPPQASHPLENELPLNFLYPHVLNLQRQIHEVTAMIELCEQLIAQKQTFKSSMHKKRADIQGIPTNLHVAYFRILRNFSIASSSSAGHTAPNKQSSTEDLLGLGFSNSNATEAPPAAPLTSQLAGSRYNAATEIHATVTCGAPTAHAMGLSEYGLREMEQEIHRLQGMLEKCTPRLRTTTSTNDGPNAIVMEDTATDYAFGALESDDSDGESEDEGFGHGHGAMVLPPGEGQPPPIVQTSAMPTKKKTKNKVSKLAARAVAKASKRLPRTTSNTKSKDGRHDSDGSSNDPSLTVVQTKYPTMKLEPEDGLETTTSIDYAVRVICRLEMLRSEYYLRKSVAVSQSVSALVTCFVATLDLHLRRIAAQQGGSVHIMALEQLARIGFLIGWESLISSQGKELRMLSDAWVAIKCLETFAFQLHPSTERDVVLEKRYQVGYTIKVPVPPDHFQLLPESLRHGQLIGITAVLFTQGINEMQSLANMVGSSGVSMQSKINSSSFKTMIEYFNRFTASGCQPDTTVGATPDEILRNLRQSVETENSASKNTCILLHAADAVRALNGGRVTYCKSGKDRTAMSVTLEQARLLVQRKRHVLQELLESSATDGPLEEVKMVANILREYGVRIEIAKKNVGRYKYSFNSIQRKLLPEIYRPPVSTIQDMVTSVTARDS